MTDKYTTNHNYRVEYVPYYGGRRCFAINLPLMRKHKHIIFHYNHLGALKAIYDLLDDILMQSDYCRDEKLEIRIFNHNHIVCGLYIDGNGDELYAALDKVERLLAAERAKQ